MDKNFIEKNILPKENYPSIGLILLVRPKVNKLSFKSLKSFKEIATNTHINKYITIPEDSYNLIKDKVEKIKKCEIIIQPRNLNLGRNKLQFLNQKIKEDYVIFLHDDDLYSSSIAQISLNIISKFLPTALALKATFINSEDYILSRRNSSKSKKLVKLGHFAILFRYFLPFERTLICPSIFYKRSVLNKYWEKNPNTIGAHEDVKMNYYLSKMGVFLELKDINHYYYRIHGAQDSSNLNYKSYLKLISWLKNIEINKIIKFILLISSFLQFYFFKKEFSFKPRFFNNIFLIIRKELIKFRAGGNPTKNHYKQ